MSLIFFNICMLTSINHMLCLVAELLRVMRGSASNSLCRVYRIKHRCQISWFNNAEEVMTVILKSVTRELWLLQISSMQANHAVRNVLL